MRRHVLRHWAAFERTLRGAPQVWLLADFDGTLARIRRHPAHVRLAASTRSVLRRLTRQDGIRVGVVSGRALATLRQLVGLSGVVYIGNHGLEMSGPSIRFIHPRASAARPTLRHIANQLRQALQDIRGSVVEDKGLSLSVHWRRVRPTDVASFHRLTEQTLTPWVRKGAVRLTFGKRVVEIRPPVVWHKGAAVAWLLDRSRGRSAHVIMLGDDRTDEDAFRLVNRRQGLSVFVGRRPSRTAARWWVSGPSEVRTMLKQLLH